jgi:hypothetical protein
VSTPTRCTEITGLRASSATLISPTRAAQPRTLVGTIWLSIPGMGVRTVPWFSAASRAGVIALSASPPSASEERMSVLTSRASLRNARAFSGGTRPASTSSRVAPCCSSSRGSSLARYSRLACSKRSFMAWLNGSSPDSMTSYRSPTGTRSPSSRVSRWSTSSYTSSLSAVRSR